MDNFEPCANHSINLNRRDPAPFAYPELECPLVARKSRLSNPYRNKLRAAISSKTIVDMALCSNTDICIKADTRRRYIQTLLNTLPHFTISDQETQPMVVWNASMEMWVFSADQHSYKLVWDLMKKHRGTFEVSGVPTAVLRVLPIKSPYLYGGGGDVYGSTNHSNDEDEDNDNPLHWMGSWFEQEVITGSNLWKSMTLDQRSKMKKGVKLGGNIFFKESLGGAKCLQALGVAYVHREKWPVVIVCHPDSSMVWKKLIQDMLPYKSRDICLLDPLPYYNGKLGLSDKPKAVQSRIYRRRKRELLRQQQLNQQDGVASASASAFSPSLITSTSTSSLTTVSPPLSPFSPKDGAHLKALQQQTGPSDDESWYIDMSNDSGDPVNPRRKSSSTNNANILPPAKVSPLPISKAPSNSPSNISAIGRKRPHSALIDEKKGVGNYSSVDGFDWPTNINHSDDDDDDNNDNGNDDGNDSNMQDTTLNTVDGSINGDLDNEEGEAFNQAIINSAELFIISYQRAKSRLRSLGKKFKVVIFDDCHELGNTMVSPSRQKGVPTHLPLVDCSCPPTKQPYND